ncbi:CsxC family protein [Bacillus sp. SG-1]|uniref:CsxC family protein n=1 Tax=Bacillus sp. SG-1 TaxID=161544 RepID=UPI0002D3BC35|nr:hypothetical protein [Bacillus sp. SG-1]
MSDKYDRHNGCVDFDKSANIGECDNQVVDFLAVPGGNTRIIHTPVQLAVRAVTTNMVANIEFPEPVMEIKDIKKRVEIVQCRLITPPVATPAFSVENNDTFPLYIKGYVRKNIQYATPCYDADGHCVSSDIKSLTVRVPFECFTNIDLDFPVALPASNTREEFDYFRAQDLGKGFPEKDQFLSSDISQFHQFSTQFYNQLPFCELLRSTIVEWDEATDRETYGTGPVGEGCFYKMVEKMQLRFVIKVLQNQQLAVTTATLGTLNDC